MDDYVNNNVTNNACGRLPLTHSSTLYQRPCHPCYTGFSLAELMTTLTIASVLTFGAGPSLSKLLTGNRISSAINEFIAHLYLTRSEAIKRGHNVIMCPSTDGIACEKSSQWQHGWIVFSDVNQNHSLDPGESVIRQHERVKGLDISSGRYRYRVRYSPLGNSYTSNTTFTFCDMRGEAPAQAVILSPSGRPRSSHLDPYNKPLKCG